jgi:hypothetical protein
MSRHLDGDAARCGSGGDILKQQHPDWTGVLLEVVLQSTV